MLWIKYTIGQNFSKYFEYNLSIITLIRFKDYHQNHEYYQVFYFSFEKILSCRKRKKNCTRFI